MERFDAIQSPLNQHMERRGSGPLLFFDSKSGLSLLNQTCLLVLLFGVAFLFSSSPSCNVHREVSGGSSCFYPPETADSVAPPSHSPGGAHHARPRVDSGPELPSPHPTYRGHAWHSTTRQGEMQGFDSSWFFLLTALW